MTPLAHLVAQKKTLVVVGPGGVGKTTAAAALAVHGARSGRRVLVLTVDPARRLANAMGLPELGNEEVAIDPSLFRAAGVTLEGGSLHAMMLDTKSTFDALIERYASTPEDAARILANPFYVQASTALAGSQEYMAMEKLYEVREQRDYDLVVLDTPPTPNALDFLSAADRLEDFLDSGSIKMLVAGTRAAGRVGLSLLKVNNLILRGLSRFIGLDTFVRLLEFIESFSDMYGGFKDRARRVKAILRSDEVAFVLLSSTERAALDEGIYFHGLLREAEMPFGAFVVNRTRRPFLEPGRRDDLGPHLVDAVRATEAMRLFSPRKAEHMAKRVARACADYDLLTELDTERLRWLRSQLGSDAGKVSTVPLFDEDIHDIRGLAAFADRVLSE